ncbi:MAG TPA: DUF6498-containing protein [Caulobacteraceae bacterium]|nr:DUF6498-containing protein [Caulobacteraceae bacterium]
MTATTDEQPAGIVMPPAPKGLLIAAAMGNILPLVGVVFLGWDSFLVLLSYWIETIVLGAVTLLRMISAGATRGGLSLATLLFLAPFFILHFGLFCTVHGTFLYAIFADGLGSGADSDAIVERTLKVLTWNEGFRWSVLAVVAIHLVALAITTVRNKGWREVEPIALMFEPYGRVVVLHLVIMAAALPVMLMGEPAWGVILLPLIKIGLDAQGLFRKTGPELQTGMESIEKALKRRLASDGS